MPSLAEALKSYEPLTTDTPKYIELEIRAKEERMKSAWGITENAMDAENIERAIQFLKDLVPNCVEVRIVRTDAQTEELLKETRTTRRVVRDASDQIIIDEDVVDDTPNVYTTYRDIPASITFEIVCEGETEGGDKIELTPAIRTIAFNAVLNENGTLYTQEWTPGPSQRRGTYWGGISYVVEDMHNLQMYSRAVDSFSGFLIVLGESAARYMHNWIVAHDGTVGDASCSAKFDIIAHYGREDADKSKATRITVQTAKGEEITLAVLTSGILCEGYEEDQVEERLAE